MIKYFININAYFEFSPEEVARAFSIPIERCTKDGIKEEIERQWASLDEGQKQSYCVTVYEVKGEPDAT